MSSFHEVQFPTDISFGSTGGPGFSTGVVTTSSGGEQRNQQWAQSRCKYNVAHGVKNQAQLDTLIAFFRARKGRAYGFRFKDWSDYTALGQICVAVPYAPGVYQLQKMYTDLAGYTDVRTVKKPVIGTVRVYVNGVLQTIGYSMDYTAGRINFDADPDPAIVTADFEFDVPCRFDTDEMPINLDNWASYSWNGITVLEIRG